MSSSEPAGKVFRKTTAPRVDFHLHTTASDGLLSPTEMVRAAREAKMTWIAITDHDTVDGVREAQRAGEAEGLPVLAGLELTCGVTEEVHLLGYGMNPDDLRLQKFLDEQMAERQDRMRSILAKLDALGYHIPMEALAYQGNQRFKGRMTLARAMVKRGYVSSVREAFDLFLKEGRPAYVPRRRIEVCRGIEMLRGFGAVVSLAHPGRMSMGMEALKQLLPSYREAGLIGLEVYYPKHPEETLPLWDALARRHGLIPTGGSDCHGDGAGHPWIGAHLRGWRTIREDTEALAALLKACRQA